MRNKKLIILYRVVQEWRASIFEKISQRANIDLEVWHGPDFKGTKVVSTTKQFNFKRVKLFSFKIKLNSKNGFIAMPFSPFLFFKLLFVNPQIVVVEGASNILNSIQAFIYAKIIGKKFIWWSLGKLQNRNYDIKRSTFDNLIQYIEKRADAIITYSSIGERYFLDIGVDPIKIFRAVNVVDTDRILRKMENRESPLELTEYKSKYRFINLFVGALLKEKSIEILLKAQAKVEEKYKDCGLIIIGDGQYREKLEEVSKELNLQNVEFLGKIFDNNYKYFSTADIFTLPGLGGLAISEAMCYGLPVIASIGDGCEVDLLMHNNGIIEPDMTVENLFNHIEFFILNEAERKLMGENSLKTIKNNYNVSTYINQILNAVNS